MAEFDLDGATEALAGELPVDDAGGFDGEESVGDNPVEESFTGFDPSTLPDDLQNVYRSMQADYTRKTQEVAELRRVNQSFSELGVDPNEAVNIVDFFKRLENDPQVANEFVSRVQSYWEQPSNANTPQMGDTPVDEGYENLPPSLAQELQAMREFREEMLFQQEQSQIMSELETVENEIRLANPQYSDQDIEAIYSLAYSTDGDLQAAAEQYHGIQQRLLGNYLQSKQVPQGATPVPTGPNSTPMSGFKNLDDAHKAAMEVVRNIS